MKFLTLTLLILFIAMNFFVANPSHAQNFDGQGENKVTELIEGEWQPIQDLFGGRPNHPAYLIAVLIKVVMSLIGILLILLIIYSGFLWMTAGGNSEQIEKAKSTLTHSVIGIFIIFIAFALARFVVGVLGCAVQTEAPDICILMLNVVF